MNGLMDLLELIGLGFEHFSLLVFPPRASLGNVVFAVKLVRIGLGELPEDLLIDA